MEQRAREFAINALTKAALVELTDGQSLSDVFALMAEFAVSEVTEATRELQAKLDYLKAHCLAYATDDIVGPDFQVGIRDIQQELRDALAAKVFATRRADAAQSALATEQARVRELEKHLENAEKILHRHL